MIKQDVDMLSPVQRLLERMDLCASALEMTVREEKRVVRRFEGHVLVGLMDRRVEVHRELAVLKEAFKARLAASGLPEAMPLEVFIDLHAKSGRSRFQSLRHRIYERMTCIEKRRRATGR